ncbi:MAG TPA: hypothetical protein VL523_14320 [Terriglobia bacterium]|nr:hypothetical protein [Terriglobia bacterium]
MSALTDEVKHEAERGLIVKVLVDWNMEYMPLHELRIQLTRRLGYRLADETMQLHLNYLAQGGYAEVKLLRAGRADLELTAVRATAQAVDLLEGRVAPNAGIGL